MREVMRHITALVAAVVAAVIYMCSFPPSLPGAYVLGFVICIAYICVFWMTDLQRRS